MLRHDPATRSPVRPTGPAWLFCPADRPERFGKALSAAAVAIIDLEDAVLRGQKSNARQQIVDLAADLDPTRTIVRIIPWTARGGGRISGPWKRRRYGR